MQFSEEKIETIINSYIKKKEREKEYYHKVLKKDKDFIIKNKSNAKLHYEYNFEKKRISYQNNKEKILLQKKKEYDFLISWGAGKNKNFSNNLLLIDLDLFK